MNDHDLDQILKNMEAPAPDENARKRAVNLAMAEFQTQKNTRKNIFQGFPFGIRPMDRSNLKGKHTMEQKHKTKLIYGGMATAMAVVLIAGISVTQLQNFGTATSDDMSLAVSAPKEEIAQNDAAMAVPEASISTDMAAVAPTIAPMPQTAAPMAMQGYAGRAEVKSNMMANKMAADSFAGAAPEAARMQYSPPPIVAPEPMPYIHVPQENRDRFESFDVNPVKLAAQEPVSTFSIDVDTASYSFVRRQLNYGTLPEKDAVRVEEMINYFDYDYPVADTREQPFKPTVTVLTSPWAKGKELVHIAIKGYDIKETAKPHSNLVFLIDVSGSMEDQNKLPLVKASMKMLLDSLQADDTVAIAVYAGAAGAVLEPTKVSDRQTILNAIDNLQAGGSTAGAEGINLAYQMAEKNFDKKGVNRVILATDGDFNVGPSSDEDLKALIEKKRESGIFLSVLGFGEGNLNDQMMQTIAQNGNGTAAYIDTLNEARKVLVDEASSTLFPIAKDVKIQVEFNPSEVSEYRLIGYETRALNREDFNNDKVDAGDIGAGHAVTAIYEITPAGSNARSIDDLRYGATKTAAPETKPSDELGYLKIRYKLPNENTSKLIETPIRKDVSAGNDDVNFAIAVAGFGQMLKDTKYTGTWSFDDAIALAQKSKGSDTFGQRAEFINLVRLAKSSSQPTTPVTPQTDE